MVLNDWQRGKLPYFVKPPWWRARSLLESTGTQENAEPSGDIAIAAKVRQDLDEIRVGPQFVAEDLQAPRGVKATPGAYAKSEAKDKTPSESSSVEVEKSAVEEHEGQDSKSDLGPGGVFVESESSPDVSQDEQKGDASEGLPATTKPGNEEKVPKTAVEEVASSIPAEAEVRSTAENEAEEPNDSSSVPKEEQAPSAAEKDSKASQGDAVDVPVNRPPAKKRKKSGADSQHVELCDLIGKKMAQSPWAQFLPKKKPKTESNAPSVDKAPAAPPAPVNFEAEDSSDEDEKRERATSLVTSSGTFVVSSMAKRRKPVREDDDTPARRLTGKEKRRKMEAKKVRKVGHHFYDYANVKNRNRAKARKNRENQKLLSRGKIKAL
ncbi:hypothetical protein HPB52_003595 [Rhipicephalus sanguineus]|uniref:Uncharacterized protein n=2 Tax=Rhipicephalus sanguineus TaxID=34632 RepID=A0A9D4T4V3_RHISA|nr:hypothetical protein HPB52_003595 [Rhipicephalus sanguineus]